MKSLFTLPLDIITCFEDVMVRLEREKIHLSARLDEDRRRATDAMKSSPVNEYIEVTTSTGRDGGIIGRAGLGIIVLFSSPPGITGEMVWMTRYEKRESKKTGKEYYKCFEWISDREKNDAITVINTMDDGKTIDEMAIEYRRKNDLIFKLRYVIKDAVNNENSFQLTGFPFNTIQDMMSRGLHDIVASAFGFIIQPGDWRDTIVMVKTTTRGTATMTYKRHVGLSITCP